MNASVVNKISNQVKIMLESKNIVLGVTGGIAAYKSCDLVSRLVKAGANVDVIMTENAINFISPLTFQALSSNQVIVDMFKEPKYWEIQHISLAKKADVVVIAPATANIIGKIANGIADDMLTTTAMATTAPLVFAPAMNSNMYENKILQSNIDRLRELGYHFIEPGEGRLACGDIGKGKMAEPYDIELCINEILNKKKDLQDKTIIITAGPTREPIDPVRFISNHSTGKMGYAIARMAAFRGADVTLVSGPVNLKTPIGVTTFSVITAQEMFETVREHYFDADIVIKAAAVADYTPAEVSSEKVKKNNLDLSLNMKRTEDILGYLGKHKHIGQFLCGFSMETQQVLEHSMEKLEKKNLDMIVANNLKDAGAGFGMDTNVVKLITRDEITELPLMSKEEVADRLLDEILLKVQ